MTTWRDYDSQAIRDALQAIAATHPNGELNPKDIVNAARDPEHPLHSRFEWDDGAAAETYREMQARALVRRVRLTIVRTDATTRRVTIATTRAFRSRPSQRTAQGGYESIAVIMSDEDKRRELLAHVMAELTVYRRRYAELVELQGVWAALDDAALEHDTTSSPPASSGEARPGAAG